MAPIEEGINASGTTIGGASGKKGSRTAASPNPKQGPGVFGRGAPAAKFAKPRSVIMGERSEKSKELLDAIQIRSLLHGKPDKLWATVGARIVPKHAFGSSADTPDPVISYAGPPNSNSDLDYSDRIISIVGSQVVLTNVEDGNKYFVAGRPDNVVGILHIAIDHTMQLISVCENTLNATEEESDNQLKSQLSIYSIASKDRECLATLIHPNSSQFTASLFTRGTGASAKQVVALCGAPMPEIVIWNWDTKKTIKVVSLPQVVSRLKCTPTAQFMLTTSGESGLRSWYHQGETLASTNLLPQAKDPNEANIIEHTWMPSGNGLNKLCALSNVLEPGDGKRNNFRRQLVYILEGPDQQDAAKSEKVSAAKHAHSSGNPVLLELRQTITLRLNKEEENAKFAAICPSTKGFVIAGNYGHISFYERTDDKREPYIEVRHLILGQDFPLVGVCMLPSEHNIVVITDIGRLLSIPVEMAIEATAVGGKGVHGDEEASSVASISEGERLVGYGAADVTHGGVHSGGITCASMAIERSIIVTLCTEDNTARVWNYETQKCEVVHYFGSDEPLSLAVHSSGFSMIVSFKDRVRGYNIGMASLKPYREVIQKGCKEIMYSHGGTYFACASGINLVVFNTSTFKQVMNFQGHMMPIKRIAWAPGDLVLFSASVDGTVYGWPTARDGRIDVVASNPRASAILGLEIDTSSMKFLPPLPDNAEDGVRAQRVEEDRFVILATLNGRITTPAWAYDNSTWNHVKNHNHVIHDEESAAVTCLKLSASRRHLFAGTKSGTVRIYAWPPVGDNKVGLYAEVLAHKGAVVSIYESPRGDRLVTAGEDGAVFCFSMVKAPWTNQSFADTKIASAPEAEAPVSAAASELMAGLGDLSEDPYEYNNQVLLLGADEMEEHVEQVANLKKQLKDLESTTAYKLSQSENSARENQRRMAAEFDETLNEERDRYEQLRTEFDDKVKSLLTTIETKESDSLKVVSDLENRYEHKLSDQLDRYDKLAEEMELLRQKCEGLLLADRNDFTKQLNDTINNARLREKKMRTENKRITDDRASDESAFKEILSQQEHEYEDELRQLIAAAEGELIVERENIGKLRTLVQTKNTKLDQLKKKLIELSMASKARATLLTNEKNEKVKLLETIEHYKKNLAEREEVVAEKEKIIMELRSKTRTLENFRFVLDHRLQQLSAERGPIASHIEGLERHISAMYEELVEEFENKKESEILKEKTEQRSNLVLEDLGRARVALRKSDRYINGFKRELGNIVSAMVIGKELEESVRLLYRKYVKGEVIGETTVKASEQAAAAANTLIHKKDDELAALSPIHGGGGNSTLVGGAGAKGKAFALEVEETLIESAKEAERQKISKGKEASQLKHRLEATRQEGLLMSRKRLGENSNLLFEVNDLRKDVNIGHRKLQERDETIKELEHQIRTLKKSLTGRSVAGDQSVSATMRAETPNIVATFNAPPTVSRHPPSNFDVEMGDSPDSKMLQGEDEGPHDRENVHTPNAVQSKHPFVLQTSKSESALRKAAGVGLDARPAAPKWIVHNALLNRAKSDAEIANINKAEVAAVQATGQALMPDSYQGAKPIASDQMQNRALKKEEKKLHDFKARDLQLLQSERDALAVQLDEAWRVRENQRVEISQLRKQLMRLSGQGFGNRESLSAGGGTSASHGRAHGTGTADDFNIQMSDEFRGEDPSIVWGDAQAGGSLVLNNEPLRVTPGLTHADRTGVPSEGDLHDMRLGSVPTEAPYPNKSNLRITQMASNKKPIAKLAKVSKTTGKGSKTEKEKSEILDANKSKAESTTTKASGNTVSLPKINPSNSAIESSTQMDIDDNEDDNDD